MANLCCSEWLVSIMILESSASDPTVPVASSGLRRLEVSGRSFSAVGVLAEGLVFPQGPLHCPCFYFH